MKRYKVLWTTSSAADLDGLIGYLDADDPKVARQIFERIRKEVAKLTAMPLKCPAVRELADVGIMNYRTLLVGPYRIIFRVDQKASVVHVVVVADSRRDLDDLLFARLIRG